MSRILEGFEKRAMGMTSPGLPGGGASSAAGGVAWKPANTSVAAAKPITTAPKPYGAPGQVAGKLSGLKGAAMAKLR